MLIFVRILFELNKTIEYDSCTQKIVKISLGLFQFKINFILQEFKVYFIQKKGRNKIIQILHY